MTDWSRQIPFRFIILMKYMRLDRVWLRRRHKKNRIKLAYNSINMVISILDEWHFWHRPFMEFLINVYSISSSLLKFSSIIIKYFFNLFRITLKYLWYFDTVKIFRLYLSNSKIFILCLSKLHTFHSSQ